MTHELVVRELSADHTLSASLAAAAGENSNNIARFFNDTPFDLKLVAVRIGCLLSVAQTAADVNQNYQVLGVAEVSRQAQIGQQEGIIGSTRCRYDQMKMTVAFGGNGNGVGTVGEILLGNFSVELMTLEVQTNIFLHSRIFNLTESTATLLLNECTNAVGCTLYFKAGKPHNR